MRECPDCGLFQHLGALRPGQVAECERCGALLRRRRRNSLRTSAALAFTGLMLLFVAAISPMLSIRIAGQDQSTNLPGLPIGFQHQDMPLLALVLLGTTMIAPFLRLMLTVLLVVGLRGNLPRRMLVGMAKLHRTLGPWAMIEVFMLGMFVAYTRLAALATVTVGIGLYALGAIMVLTAWLDCWLDEDALWAEIDRAEPRPTALAPRLAPRLATMIGCDTCGQVSHGTRGEPCIRCDAPLRDRKPQAIGRTWALMIAAGILYIPANILPVMTVIRFGRGAPSTILGGVQELIEYRMWPLAALVFVASVLVPMLKLVGLAILLITTQFGVQGYLQDRTRIYRLVEFIGRWSMIDVFMLSILTALVRMGALAGVIPGYGAVAFAAVVVLTMLASHSFDPRLMWDAAEARQTRRSRLQAEAVQA